MKCEICNKECKRNSQNQLYCKDCRKEGMKKSQKKYYNKTGFPRQKERHERNASLWKSYSDEEQIDLIWLKAKEIMKEWY